MGRPKRYYVRQAVQSWGTLKIKDIFDGEFSAPQPAGTKAVGFMLVFPTKRAFKKEHPGETPLSVTVCKKTQ